MLATFHQQQPEIQNQKFKKSISYPSSILHIVSSAYEGALGVVLVATESSIVVENISVKDRIAAGFERETICTYPVGSKATSLALSPSTRPSAEKVIFAAAFEDRSLVLYHSGKLVELLNAKTWVNDSAFDSTGTVLATVSDDDRVRVWSNLNSEQADVDSFCEVAPAVFPLQSRPVSVQFHKRQANYILIGEVSGRVSLMDVQDGTLLTSVIVNSGLDLLRSCSWHSEDPSIFGIVSESNWSIFQFPQDELHSNGSLLPEHHGDGSEGCAGRFVWNPSSPKMFAVPGKSVAGVGGNPSIHVFPNGFTKVPLTFHLPNKSRITGIAWNATSSILYVTSGCKIHLIELSSL